MRYITIVLALSTLPVLASPDAAQVAAIQQEIAGLQIDIASMQKQAAKDAFYGGSKGGYADRIAQEQARIASLRAQLR